jgi:hypothetical protein
LPVDTVLTQHLKANPGSILLKKDRHRLAGLPLS